MKRINQKSKNQLRTLGIMNGTSLDGVDFVLIDTDFKKENCKYISMQSFLFPKKLRDELRLATQHQLHVDRLAIVHHDLGRFYANCFKKLKPIFKKIDGIGLHGQTVFHSGGKATLQIGEPSYLAAISDVPVVSDFRVADIAVGGQGAPLATLFHQYIFGDARRNRTLHNLGGISNVTIIRQKKVTQGFDTGPANMLMDLTIQLASHGKKRFDRNGQIAKKGQVDQALVQQMLQHDFFKKRPPKSCGREEFGEVFLKQHSSGLERLSVSDQLATITDFVAQSIVQSYQKFCDLESLDEIIFCGGGSKNKFLISQINVHLNKVISRNLLSKKINLRVTDDLGWPTQSIEGAAFALLAAFKLINRPSNLPQSTGAAREVSLGKITIV